MAPPPRRGRRNPWDRCNPWHRYSMGSPQPMESPSPMGSPQSMGSPRPMEPPRPMAPWRHRMPWGRGSPWGRRVAAVRKDDGGAAPQGIIATPQPAAHGAAAPHGVATSHKLRCPNVFARTLPNSCSGAQLRPNFSPNWPMLANNSPTSAEAVQDVANVNRHRPSSPKFALCWQRSTNVGRFWPNDGRSRPRTHARAHSFPWLLST